MSNPSSSTGPSRWTVLFISFVVALAPMLVWSVGSPLMSVPDEPSHAIRAAAVVRGQLGRTPFVEQPTQSAAVVPASIAAAHSLPCFAFHPEISAGCQVPLTTDPDRLVTTGTTAGLNSPVYYAVVGLPSLVVHGEAAFTAMRVLNSILCAALLAVMFMQLCSLPAHRWAVICAAAAITPMLLFLGGAINPNSVEAAAAGALLATLLATFRSRSSPAQLWGRVMLVVVSTLFLVSGRSIGLLWVVLVVGTALILSDRSVLRSVLVRPAAWVAVGASALIGAMTMVWFLDPPRFAAEPTASAADPITWLFIAGVTLIRSIDYAAGLIGVFGWGETPMPPFTGAVWAAVVAAVLATAVFVATPFARRMLFGAILVMLAVPPIVQASAYAEYGFIWQGRYLLAPFLCTIVLAGFAIDGSGRIGFRPGVRRLVLVAAAFLGVGQVLAFFTTMVRFVVGSTGTPLDLIAAPQWLPPIHWATLVAALTTVMAAAWLAFVRLIDRADPATDAVEAISSRAALQEHDGEADPPSGGSRVPAPSL
ncbi:DUF2142 domain-containing protein [Plantibacter sp. YIM 135249]|uniref:DUF2142 domain-containing protein n=1 Tax=Plantibacter sp. YIM 135249 TaxID=3423918 RepID=UPI003D354F45